MIKHTITEFYPRRVTAHDSNVFLVQPQQSDSRKRPDFNLNDQTHCVFCENAVCVCVCVEADGVYRLQVNRWSLHLWLTL